jgi:hypothetical protein
VKTETLSLDFDTSEKISGLIDVLPKQCWMNAIRALPHLSGGWYVEGWLIIDGYPLAHGWCEWEGMIVDPTLYNQLGIQYFYLPGVKYSLDDVVERVSKMDVTLPIIEMDRHGGFSNKSYRDAFYQAIGICGGKDSNE